MANKGRGAKRVNAKRTTISLSRMRKCSGRERVKREKKRGVGCVTGKSNLIKVNDKERDCPEGESRDSGEKNRIVYILK